MVRWPAVGGSDPTLRDLEVLVVDCQATAAASRGHLLEIGWARLAAVGLDAHACLVKLPPNERIPPAVARITGIADRALRAAVEPEAAWRQLAADAARLPRQPAPTVIHFASFERPFLAALAGGSTLLDIVCTHEIATRLLPGLPRRSLRALAGYFGRSVGTLRRSASHVDATAFVWRELVRLLEAEGITSWPALRDWLSQAAPSKRRSRRMWPMPRDLRLALPDAPGIYRMLRTSGDVLYVGKAVSLRRRVNSYFRHQHGIHERTLEMLSQARGLSFEVVPTALEAAILESDEIKRHRPPYNVALTLDDRAIWFAAADLRRRSTRPSPSCRIGPFPSGELLEAFAALAQGSRTALGHGRYALEETTFDSGLARFRSAHTEMSRSDLGETAKLLRVGTRLWREGRRDADFDDDSAETSRAWTPASVQVALEWLVLRAALARRRAKWLTRLVDAAVVWSEPGSATARLLTIEEGGIASVGDTSLDLPLPVPPGHRRSSIARHQALDPARFDRLRILITELKRLVAVGAPVAVRLGAASALSGARLASALAWV